MPELRSKGKGGGRTGRALHSCGAPSKVPSDNSRRGAGGVRLPTKLLPCKRGPCSSLCTSAGPGRAGVSPTDPRVPGPLPPMEVGRGGCADAEADMPLAGAAGAICVQRFDGSRNSAIHTTYRISLRSSSIREPRYPLLRVVFGLWLGGRKRRPEPIASEWFEVWGVLRLNELPSGPPQ